MHRDSSWPGPRFLPLPSRWPRAFPPLFLRFSAGPGAVAAFLPRPCFLPAGAASSAPGIPGFPSTIHPARGSFPSSTQGDLASVRVPSRCPRTLSPPRASGPRSSTWDLSPTPPPGDSRAPCSTRSFLPAQREKHRTEQISPGAHRRERQFPDSNHFWGSTADLVYNPPLRAAGTARRALGTSGSFPGASTPLQAPGFWGAEGPEAAPGLRAAAEGRTFPR